MTCTYQYFKPQLDQFILVRTHSFDKKYIFRLPKQKEDDSQTQDGSLKGCVLKVFKVE